MSANQHPTDLVAEIVREYHRAEPHLAPIVREAGIARLRRQGVADAEQLVDEAIAAAAPKSRVTKAHIGDVLVRELERMHAPQIGISTPFRLLNHVIVGGFQPGELIYLGARPAVGKSALALDFARHVAKRGAKVLLVSREMHDLALARRMLAQEGHLSASQLRLGASAIDMRDVARVAEKLSGLPIWITDSAATLAEIDAMAEDTDFLIVDYLQLVVAPKEIRERRLQVEHSSAGLKALALARQIPVLCLSSLSRPKEGTNPEPTLASFRETGEIEHDADIAMLLHKPEPQGDEVICIIAKNRDGETGRVKLVFRRDWVSFHQAEDGGRYEPVPYETNGQRDWVEL